MKTVTCISATTKIDQDNDRFTKSALNMFAEKSIGVPVILNFDTTKPIGRIISSEVESECLVVVAKIYDECIIEDHNQYIVPGFRALSCTMKGNKLRVIEKVEPLSYGLVFSPTDLNVTPIKLK